MGQFTVNFHLCQQVLIYLQLNNYLLPVFDIPSIDRYNARNITELRKYHCLRYKHSHADYEF